MPDVDCRNCGVRLRRFRFTWRHTSHLGPVACPNGRDRVERAWSQVRRPIGR